MGRNKEDNKGDKSMLFDYLLKDEGDVSVRICPCCGKKGMFK